jgi:hypothetical protein
MHLKSKMLASQLLVYSCVNLRIENHLTFLPPPVVGQQLASASLTRLKQLTITSTWELLEQED